MADNDNLTPEEKLVKAKNEFEALDKKLKAAGPIMSGIRNDLAVSYNGYKESLERLIRNSSVLEQVKTRVQKGSEIQERKNKELMYQANRNEDYFGLRVQLAESALSCSKDIAKIEAIKHIINKPDDKAPITKDILKKYIKYKVTYIESIDKIPDKVKEFMGDSMNKENIEKDIKILNTMIARADNTLSASPSLSSSSSPASPSKLSIFSESAAKAKEDKSSPSPTSPEPDQIHPRR